MWKPATVSWRSSVEPKFLMFLGMLTLAASAGIKPLAAQAHEQNTAERKVVTRIEPEYPETLKRLYIGGVVRIEAIVAANGTVDSMELLGGNPILGQSAMKALKHWKYAPASSKAKVLVQVEFDPHR